MLRRLTPALLTIACLCWPASSPVSAAEPARKSINLPADAAERSLKKFSDQAGVEIVFATGAATGIRTNAVKGDYTPLEALRLLLAGTALTATQDPTTGAILISRSEPPPPPKAEAARAELPPAARAANPVVPRASLTASAGAASSANDSTVVTLNEFTVTADAERGYLAGNAISGTKTNTALRDLPISISVITSEVLDDLNATLPSDALNYSSSVAITSGQTIGNGQGSPLNVTGSTVTVRGSGTFFAMRDGFRAYNEPSAIGVQRIEVVKGPAAVLYGVTKPGGIINYISKTPQFGKNTGRATFSYGSYQTTRSTIDLNYGRLAEDKVAVRLNASYHDLASWYRFSKSTEYAISPSVAYRPWSGTEISVLYEYNLREFPAISTDYFARPVPGFRGSSVPFFIYPTSAADPVATLTPQLAPGLTPDFTFRGYGSLVAQPSKTLVASLAQKVGEHLSFNFQFSRNRRNNLRENFGITAQFTGVVADASAANTALPLPRLRKQYLLRDGYNELDNFALTAIYRRDFTLPLLGSVGVKLVGGLSKLADKFEDWQVQEFRSGTANRLAYFSTLAPDSFTGVPPQFPAGEIRRVASLDVAENNDFKLAYLAGSAEFMEKRAILNAGLTRTLFRQSRVQFDATGTVNTGFVNPASQNSPLVGAILRPLPWVSVYLQASKSFNPNTSARDGFGNPLAPEQGKGRELGLKLDPWSGRLSANFAIFNTIEANRLITDPNAPNSDSFYLDAAGRPQPLSGPNDPRYDPNLPGQQKSARAAVGEATTDGFEAEVIWSANRNFQLLGSYTYLDGYVSRDLNTSIATWQSRPLPNNYYHRASALAKYQFSQGALKNFDIVLGLNWRSRIFRDALNADGGAATALTSPVARYGKPSWDGDVKLGYRAKIFGRKTNLQFNVKNIFGREIAVGWQPTTARAYSFEQYYYTVPRTYSFTIGFEL